MLFLKLIFFTKAAARLSFDGIHFHMCFGMKQISINHFY